MPITPLHYGAIAPFNHFFPGKVNVVSFTIVTLWMSGNATLYFMFGVDRPQLPDQTTSVLYELLGGLVLASIVAVFGFRSRKWVVGAYYGAVTHVLVGMLYQSGAEPLYPIHWNPFYAGFTEPLSLLLVPLLIWFMFQCVRGVLALGGSVDSSTLETPLSIRSDR
jgi:hypothetical protein